MRVSRSSVECNVAIVSPLQPASPARAGQLISMETKTEADGLSRQAVQFPNNGRHGGCVR